MKLWMYYVTDGDSGYYRICIFSTKNKALEYKDKVNDPYAEIEEFTVDKENMSFKEEHASAVLCPNCGSKMISRNGQFGAFWGCSDYPQCKGTRDSLGRSKEDRAKEKGESYEKDNNDVTNKFSFKRTK